MRKKTQTSEPFLRTKRRATAPLRSLHVALRPENRQAGKGSGLRWLGIRATRDHPHAVYYSRTGTPPTEAAPHDGLQAGNPAQSSYAPILPLSRQPRPSTNLRCRAGRVSSRPSPSDTGSRRPPADRPEKTLCDGVADVQPSEPRSGHEHARALSAVL